MMIKKIVGREGGKKKSICGEHANIFAISNFYIILKTLSLVTLMVKFALKTYNDNKKKFKK